MGRYPMYSVSICQLMNNWTISMFLLLRMHWYNIHMWVFMWTHALISLGYMLLQTRFAGSYGNSMSTFYRTARWVSKAVVAQHWIPNSNVWGFQCLYILTMLFIVSFYYNHPSDCEEISHGVFDIPFSDDYNVEDVFMSLYLCILLVNCVFVSFAHF